MDLDSPPKLLPISFSGFTPGWSKSMHQDATLHITEITTYTHTHPFNGSLSWTTWVIQITMPAPHHSVFYRLDALPATQPTVSKHWRQLLQPITNKIIIQRRCKKSQPQTERSWVIAPLGSWEIYHKEVQTVQVIQSLWVHQELCHPLT